MNFLHVADAAEAIAIAAEKNVECVPINLGTGIETSIADLTKLIATMVGYEGEVAWDTSKPDGQPKRYLDVTRAKELLGFEANISLEDGIKENRSMVPRKSCAGISCLSIQFTRWPNV